MLLQLSVVESRRLSPKFRPSLLQEQLGLVSYMFHDCTGGGNPGRIIHCGAAGDVQQHFPGEAPVDDIFRGDNQLEAAPA